MDDARALLDSGIRYEKHGLLDRALEEYQRAGRAAVTPEALAEALFRQSWVHRSRCDWPAALAAARHAAEVAAGARLDRALGESLNALAAVHHTRGDLDAARPIYERVLEVTGDARVRGLAQQNLGTIAAQRGAHDEAARRFGESRRSFEEAGYRWGEAFALTNLTALAIDRGDREAARQLGEEAVVVAREVDDHEIQGAAMMNLAETLAALGQVTEAEALASAALGVFTIAGNPMRRVHCLRLLGDLHGAAGDDEVARRCWEQARVIAAGIEAKGEEAELSRRLGESGAAR
jgi:tetratricopeptide (TPR) repeat protein